MILSTQRNENRKKHHEELDRDSKMAKKAFRAIGLGVEFNEMHDFKTTISIDEDIYDSKTEYIDDTVTDGMMMGDDRLGIVDMVPGEDENGEFD